MDKRKRDPVTQARVVAEAGKHVLAILKCGQPRPTIEVALNVYRSICIGEHIDDFVVITDDDDDPPKPRVLEP